MACCLALYTRIIDDIILEMIATPHARTEDTSEKAGPKRLCGKAREGTQRAFKTWSPL